MSEENYQPHRAYVEGFLGECDPVERAFNRSEAGYEFGGCRLHKFTAQRQAAAATMGLRFGLVNEADIYSISVESLKEGVKTNIELTFYNQMFADVVTVIWLCNVADSRVLRALRKVDEAQLEAYAWADTQGITLTSDRYYEAAGVFFQIMQDITVSTAVPKFENEDTGGDYDPND